MITKVRFLLAAVVVLTTMTMGLPQQATARGSSAGHTREEETMKTAMGIGMSICALTLLSGEGSSTILPSRKRSV